MSSLRLARAYIDRGNANSVLKAFTQWKDAELTKDAARAADERWRLGRQLSEVDGRLIAVKDNICTTDLPTTCASKALNGYTSPFEATVIKRLVAAGAIISGKTNLDEFGMGSHSWNSHSGAVKQDAGQDSISAGGSSGGSAVAVKTDQCWAALGTDTGGSVRLPAAYTGCVGFKPSYGMISRYGVIPYANSLDTVGILASSVDRIKAIFGIVRGHDSRDPTSLKGMASKRTAPGEPTYPKDGSLRIGIPIEYNIAELDPIVREEWKRIAVKLQSEGHQVVPVSLPNSKLALPAYYVLAPAEASSNLAKYDGVRYGNPASTERQDHNVLFATGRGENLGEEVKRRILLGSFTLSASAIDNYFIQAQRVRRLVKQDFNRIFSFPDPLTDDVASIANGMDLLLAPTAPSLPPKVADLVNRKATDSYRDDVLTVPASLAGLPAISLPGRTEDVTAGSIGFQLIGQSGDDDLVLESAARLAKIVDGSI